MPNLGIYGPSAPTSEAFGFNLGDGLQNQQQGETDEERRRRLNNLPPESPGQSPQVRALFDTSLSSVGGLGGRSRRM
jgi:hypothetical protein